jgi:O-antigen/teichoic acid export membrane protein
VDGCRVFFGRAFVRDAAGLSTAEAVGAASSALQTILVARWLGPYAAGVVALILAYPSVVFAVFEPQSSQAGIRYLGEFRTRGEDSRSLAMVRLGYLVDSSLGGLAFLFVVATAAFAQANVVGASGTASLLIVYSASSALHTSVATSRSVMLTAGRFRALAWERAVTTVAGNALSVAFVALGWRVAGAIWGVAIGIAVEAVVLFVLTQRTTRDWGGAWWRTRGEVLGERRGEIIRFIAYSDAEGLVTLVTRRLDVVLLGFLRGPVDAGYYRIARALSALPGHLAWPLESTVYQRLAAIGASEGETAVLAKGRRYALYAGVPLGLGLLATIPLIPFAIRITVGDAYAPAIPATQVLMAGSAVSLAAFWMRPLMLTLGYQRFWVANSAVFVVASVIGFVWLTDRFGFIGMAWVYSVMVAAQYVVGLGYLAHRSRTPA